MPLSAIRSTLYSLNLGREDGVPVSVDGSGGDRSGTCMGCPQPGQFAVFPAFFALTERAFPQWGHKKLDRIHGIPPIEVGCLF